MGYRWRAVRRLLDSRLFIAITAALVGAGIVGAIWALSSGGEDRNRGGEVHVSFEPGPHHDVALLQSSGAFRRAIAAVNYELDFPVDLKVRVVGGETAARVGAATGPFYEPRNHTVYFPWSFVAQSAGDLKRLERLRLIHHTEIDRLLVNAMTYVLYHELAHGVINVLDVPVVGGEELNADSLASIFAIESHDRGHEVPLGAAALEEASALGKGTPTLSDFADEHGFDRQRAFNALCLVYGSSPAKHASLIKSGRLPGTRSRICQFEYENDLRAWRRLLSRWLTHTGGLLPLPL